MKKTTFILGFCILLIPVLFVVSYPKTLQISQISPNPQNIPIPQISPTPTAVFAKVTRVYDGDTIEVEGGQKVRYIGIDTTEVYPKVECYSLEAKFENEKLVLGKTIRMEKDVSDKDGYGRLLRYVYVDGEFVNEKLVRNGHAKVATYSPDVKYQMNFLESEKYARENKLGLWPVCKST